MKCCYLIVLLFLISSCIGGVLADISTVPAGGTVFIGEEQLDIRASGISPGSQIAWWAPGTSVDETPADTVTVGDPGSFSVLTSTFAGKEGTWYSIADRTPVIKVKQPKLAVKITDTTAGFDATGKWMPRGDIASFQIETNLYELRSRSGVSGAPVDIIIQSPGGAQYSAVSGPAGSFSLFNIPVSSSLYDTGPVWSTGGTDSGTYQIHAECTANRLNSNNALPGAGVSTTIEVLIQDVNPLINSSENKEGNENPVPTSTTQPSSPSITPTTSPSTSPISGQPSPTSASPVQDMTTSEVPTPVQTTQGSMQPLITPSAVSSPASPIPTSSSSPVPSGTPAAPFSGLIAVLALAVLVIRR